MTIHELTERLVTVLGGGIPIHRDYETTAFSAREKSFAVVGLSSVKITDESDAQRYVATFGIALYDSPKSSGAKLLSMAHSFFHPKLFASELNIESLTATAISYNARLDRLEYCFSLAISCTLVGDVISPEKAVGGGVTSFPLGAGLTLRAKTFSFSRGRALTQIPTICSGAFLGDGGNDGISLSLKGCLIGAGGAFLQSGAAVKALEGLLGTAISASFLEITLPKLRLKNYQVSAGERLPVCEVTLESASPSEVVGLV